MHGDIDKPLDLQTVCSTPSASVAAINQSESSCYEPLLVGERISTVWRLCLQPSGGVPADSSGRSTSSRNLSLLGRPMKINGYSLVTLLDGTSTLTR